MINIENLTKIYKRGSNSVTALSDINLHVKKGEFLGILGESGSGKTTLSNIIAGLVRPTKGKVIVNDMDIWKLKDKDISRYRNKTLGFVFQSFNLIPEFTALENVMLPLVYSGVPKNKRISLAKEALSKVGLSDRINHKPNEMSGGQMQRVSIARAVVNNPSVIIADEPTGNLDSKSSENIMNILRDVNKKGVTILTVTHNLSHKDYFSEIITVDKGKITGL